MIDQNTQPLENAGPLQPESPSVPSVIISQNNPNVPKWFYFIFGLTVIVFFLVTTLIILQLIQKKESPSQSASVPAPASPEAQPSPTLTFMEATDSAVFRLREVARSDELSSIEADLKNTDLNILEQSLMIVDNQTGAY